MRQPADLHETVPGKFIAMRGPGDLLDGQFSHREFSPRSGARAARAAGGGCPLRPELAVGSAGAGPAGAAAFVSTSACALEQRLRSV